MKHSLPTHGSTPAMDVAALARAVAPAPVRLTYCASNALPFRLEWDAARGPVRFYGLSPDAAASEACAFLQAGSGAPAARESRASEPSGDGEWAEAMRGLIADMAVSPAPSRPVLRLVRS